MDQAEQVLCVWREVVSRLRPWTGWADYAPDLWDTVQRGAMLEKRTPELEANTDLLQLVVYGVVSFDDQHGENRTLVYRRGKAGSEDRLHRKLSLGIGGHVNRDDMIHPAIMRWAIFREIKEELGVVPITIYEHGILFDASKTGVDAVHLGLVFDVRVDESEMYRLESEAACEPVGWLTEDEIREMYFRDRDQFETWSQWVIRGSMMSSDEVLSSNKETA